MGKLIDLAVERAKRETKKHNEALKAILEKAKKLDWSSKDKKDE